MFQQNTLTRCNKTIHEVNEKWINQRQSLSHQMKKKTYFLKTGMRCCSFATSYAMKLKHCFCYVMQSYSATALVNVNIVNQPIKLCQLASRINQRYKKQ